MSLEAMMEKLAASMDRLSGNLEKAAGGAAPAAPAASGGKAATASKATKPKVTQDQLAEKANALKEKSGMPAVREIFKKFGSASGKMGEVPEAKYADVIAAIDAALGDDEQAPEDDSL